MKMLAKYLPQARKGRIVVVNAAWHLGGRAGAEILERASKIADVILGCEMKYVDARKVLDPEVWRIFQNTSDDGKQGSLIAVRRDRVKVYRHGMALGTDNDGERMEDRYFQWAVLKIKGRRGRFLAVAGHFPPKRYWRLWPRMQRSLQALRARVGKGLPVVVGCDWNKLERAVEPATGLDWRGDHIVGLAFTKSMKFGRGYAIQVGSDHKAVLSFLS